jgi:hypothetical protein
MPPLVWLPSPTWKQPVVDGHGGLTLRPPHLVATAGGIPQREVHVVVAGQRAAIGIGQTALIVDGGGGGAGICRWVICRSRPDILGQQQ